MSVMRLPETATLSSRSPYWKLTSWPVADRLAEVVAEAAVEVVVLAAAPDAVATDEGVGEVWKPSTLPTPRAVPVMTMGARFISLTRVVGFRRQRSRGGCAHREHQVAP